MSIRWMAVQYVGNVLRMPVVNEGDMDKPFGSSVLERDVNRIVVNPFSDSPQVFVPESECEKLREERDHWHVEQVHAFGNWEDAHRRVIELEAENAKLRELVKSMYYDLTHMTFPPDWVTDYEADMRELGVGVDG